MTASLSIDRTKIEEIGTDGLVDWKTGIPSVSVTLRQLEYGNIEFWKQLANTTTADTLVNFTDFKTPKSDIACYKTDDNAVFLGTIWYPELRCAGFSLSIGDPEALIERSFSLVGEDEIVYQGANEYVIQLIDALASGVGHTIQIGTGTYANYPAPVDDPDNSGTMFIRGLRVRSGTTTALTEGTDFTWATDTITIPASLSGDTYKFYYSAASYITGVEPFVSNSSDLAGISADSCSVYLQTSNYVYRLQSVSIDVAFDRFDVKEIGNSNVVTTGTKDITTTVTLGKILEDWTIEEILRGESADYGKIDPKEFSSDISLIVKVYSDANKGTFKCGYKLTGLAPTGLEGGVPLNDYVTRGCTLEGESGLITSVEGSL